jgi:hypothetical protein
VSELRTFVRRVLGATEISATEFSVRRKLVRRNFRCDGIPVRHEIRLGSFGTSRKSVYLGEKIFRTKKEEESVMVDAVLFNGRLAPMYIVLTRRTRNLSLYF